MRNKLLFLPFFLLLVPGPSMARESIPRDTVGVKVYFRQNHASLDSLFRDNGSRLDSFSRRLSSFRGDTALQIRSVRVVSGASPEGSSEINRSLSERRSAAIRSYLEKRGSLEGYAFDVESRGVNWEELAALVESSDMPNRDEVLEILYHTPEFVIREGEVVDSRQRQLGMLHGGQPWHYMEERFFPELRASGVHVVFETGEMEASSPEPVVPSCDTVVAEHRDTVEVVRRDTVVVPGPVVPSRKPFYMALKTNLLYDVTLVPNIGAEFYLGRGWSLGGNWMYAWWNSNKRHNYWRLLRRGAGDPQILRPSRGRKTAYGASPRTLRAVVHVRLRARGYGLHGRQAGRFPLGKMQLRRGCGVRLLVARGPSSEPGFRHRCGLLGRRIPYIRPRRRSSCPERDQAAPLVRPHESGNLPRVADRPR